MSVGATDVAALRLTHQRGFLARLIRMRYLVGKPTVSIGTRRHERPERGCSEGPFLFLTQRLKSPNAALLDGCTRVSACVSA
jgi:hypothetical protein